MLQCSDATISTPNPSFKKKAPRAKPRKALKGTSGAFPRNQTFTFFCHSLKLAGLFFKEGLLEAFLLELSRSAGADLP